MSNSFAQHTNKTSQISFCYQNTNPVSRQTKLLIAEFRSSLFVVSSLIKITFIREYKRALYKSITASQVAEF